MDSVGARNVAAYSSDEAVATYRENAAGDGLFETEEFIFDRYFESGSRVLDVGCGAGRTTVELARRDIDVVGIDVSEPMVDAAMDAYPDLTFEVGDATALRFEDESFDHVLFSYCGIDYVHPEEDRVQALREIRRVLRPGGYFAFSTHNALYALPALLDDWGHLRNVYVDGGNWRRVGERYKTDEREYGVETHYTTPIREFLELRSVDFEFVTYVGKRANALRFFERRPYYVA